MDSFGTAISAEKFVRTFKAGYSRDARRRTSVIAESRRRAKEREEAGIRPAAYDASSDWTQVMALFLASLARVVSCTQVWEREGRIDCVWYGIGSRAAKPYVVIEHEQHGEERERIAVRKLLKAQRRATSAKRVLPLAVLIT
ncbi:MAG: hypothetical protein WA691_06345 [Thermoplasmata archaeon]